MAKLKQQENQAANATAQAAGGFTEVAPAEVKSKKKREKKERVPKTLWGTRDEDGNLVTKIVGTTVEGFDPEKNLPLRRRDFQESTDFLKLQIERQEASLANLKKELADELSLGNSEQRKKVKQAKSLKDRITRIQTELKEAGMSDEQIAQFLA